MISNIKFSPFILIIDNNNSKNYQEFCLKYDNLVRLIKSKMLVTDKQLMQNLETIKNNIEQNISEDKLYEFNRKWKLLNNMASGKTNNTFTLDEIFLLQKK